jgi:PAS domain S-box-containing protein
MSTDGSTPTPDVPPADAPSAETDWLRRAREHQSLLLAIAEQSPMMIWRAGRDAQCDYFNQRWLEFTGRTLAEEEGDGWAAGVHPDDLHACVETYLTHFERRQPFEMEYRLRRFDGEYRWVLDRASPYFDDSGEFLGYLGSCIDIHERKQYEAELREASHARDQFLALLSHELRTPLQPILTAAQTLLIRHRGDATWERPLQLIERNARRQARLVEDVLDISRLMRGTLLLERAPVDLAKLVEQCAQEIEPATAAKQVTLTVAAPETPLMVVGDRRRMAQVVTNLLDNAVKYTSAGDQIALSAAAGEYQALLQVRDTGMGIDPQQLPGIFELFTSAEPSQRHSQAGLGLGLAIVRSLVERHGGSVTAASEGPHRGSLFTVRLPLAPPDGE